MFKEQNVNFPQKHNFTANQCDFCCLSDTSSEMRGFTSEKLSLSLSQQSLFLLVFMSTVLKKGLERRKMARWQNFGSQFFYHRQKSPTFLSCTVTPADPWEWLTPGGRSNVSDNGWAPHNRTSWKSMFSCLRCPIQTSLVLHTWSNTIFYIILYHIVAYWLILHVFLLSKPFFFIIH